MALFVVIEVLNEDGSPVSEDSRDFDIAQLKMLEQDRQDDGYVNLDGTNYVFNAKIIGVVDGKLDEGRPVIRPIESAL